MVECNVFSKHLCSMDLAIIVYVKYSGMPHRKLVLSRLNLDFELC